jgi:hypothetical protein
MKKYLPIVAVCAALGVTAGASAQKLPNPNAVETERGRNNPCADPWLSYAVSVAKSSPGVVGRAAGEGSTGECNTKLYNNGNWGSYDELVGHARATIAMLASQNVKHEVIGRSAKVVLIDPKKGVPAQSVVGVISGNAAAFVQPSPVISGGAGNIISGGAGNIISGGAGNVVLPGQRNLLSTDGAKFSFKLPAGALLRVR